MDSRFFGPTYSIVIVFYWTRKKIILTSPVINLWKESSIQEIRHITGISLNDEDAALAKNALQMVIPLTVSYLYESGFSAMAVIKTKYQPRTYEHNLRGVWGW